MKSRAKPIVSLDVNDHTIIQHKNLQEACWKFGIAESSAQEIIKSKDRGELHEGHYWFSKLKLAELWLEELEHAEGINRE